VAISHTLAIAGYNGRTAFCRNMCGRNWATCGRTGRAVPTLGLSLAAGEAFAAKFPWRDYGSVIDIGCAQGAVPVAIATAHNHLTGGGYDLPPVEPIFNSYVAQHGLGDRLRFTPGDFFADPLPNADVLVMGHILHDWDLDEKRLLLQKAHDALPTGGALIVFEGLIDDDRRDNAFGSTDEPQYVDRDPRRLRLHRCRLPRLDGRDGVQQELRRAPRRPRLDGCRNQVARPGMSSWASIRSGGQEAARRTTEGQS
jgi:hypothetical protein